MVRAKAYALDDEYLELETPEYEKKIFKIAKLDDKAIEDYTTLNTWKTRMKKSWEMSAKLKSAVVEKLLWIVIDWENSRVVVGDKKIWERCMLWDLFKKIVCPIKKISKKWRYNVIVPIHKEKETFRIVKI